MIIIIVVMIKKLELNLKSGWTGTGCHNHSLLGIV